MIEKIGIAALVVLVATESFAFSEAILWAVAAGLRLGEMALDGTFVISAVLALAAGWLIGKSALAHRDSQSL